MTTPAASAQRLTEAGYQIEIAVQGYPGKAVCHGGLGWSTIALLRGHGRVVLIDTGAFGQRQLVIDRLAAHGLTPADVTDVVLTHSHWDHSVNWVMFANARVLIDAHELAWSLDEPWGTTPVPELYVRELDRSPQLVRIAGGQQILPGLMAHHAPGHTPGHLIFVLEGADRDIIFTGDAAKNRAEILSESADMTYDQAISRTSIQMIRRLWQQKSGTILIPGHDVPMILQDGLPTYIADRQGGIAAWFDTTLDQTKIFDIT